jgi:RecA-family ATPase
MQKDVAHVAGKDWFGSMPTVGPAWYLGAEDDENEIHIRFHDIAAHYGVTFKELIESGLRVLCLLGQDATLCAATGKSGKVETTALYRQLYEAAGDLKPKNISVDTLSRAFAGNEIDRVQVYAFAMHMQALAMAADGSVTILSHPSLQGIASGSGISGSTAWHGAFRFRQYLKSPKSTASADEPDTDIRELEFKKNQYGPRGASIAVRYRNGVFMPVGSIPPLAQLAEEARVDELFLTLLDKFTAQQRYVTDKTGRGYAPSEFEKSPDARGLKSPAFAPAMQRLFAQGKIIMAPRPGSPPTKQDRLVIARVEEEQ